VEGTSARLITVSGGKIIGTLAGHSAKIRSVWLSADALTAVTASDDGTVRTWDTRTGQSRRTIAGDVGPIQLMAVSPNGRHALVQGRACAILDLTQGRRLQTINDLATNHLAALPDNLHVLCGCLDGTVRKVHLLSGKAVQTWTHHPGKVDHVTIRADGKRAVSTGSGGTLAIWDVTAGKPVHTTKAADSYGTTLLSPDGRFLACIAPLSTHIRLLELPAK
jgi:tricorn protease-like protein